MIQSIQELAERVHEPRFGLLRRFYAVSNMPAVRLTMTEPGWLRASAAFGTPRADVENQHIVSVRDLHLEHEALFNPLRLNRIQPVSGRSAVELIDQQRREEGCFWCEDKPEAVWLDEFGEVRSLDGRIVARGNWARSCVISGIVYGDESMHNLLRLSKPDFVSMFVTAEKYMVQARNHLSQARYFLCFLNGGPKSASGVPHCHLQVLGRTDRHFGYAEAVRTHTPSDYWQQVEAIHQDLGLCLSAGQSVGWVNVAPVKERDLVVASPSIESGASLVFDLLQGLFENGTNNFTVAAIPSPEYFGDSDEGDRGFRGWPAVLWRLLDRGDMRARHSDIGAAELFGSAVIAADPWLVRRWLRGQQPG